MSRPREGGQSSRTKSYSSCIDSRALRSRFSRENWLTSSISAPARSIVDGMAESPGTSVVWIASRISAPAMITLYVVVILAE